jgi:hypothetical protein
MPELVYCLSALTSLICAVLLIRGYCKTRTRLLLWTCVGFVGLALNNIFLILDYLIFPQHDLRVLRDATILIALVPMIYGLISES